MTFARRTITLITLAAYVLLCTAGAGWVLCSGTDGHVAVEALAAGCCGDPPPADECPDGDHDDHGHEDHDDGCGDCNDVALADLLDARKSQHDLLDAPVAHQAAFAPACPSLAVTPQCRTAAPRGPPRAAPRQQHLTTVILRL